MTDQLKLSYEYLAADGEPVNTEAPTTAPACHACDRVVWPGDKFIGVGIRPNVNAEPIHRHFHPECLVWWQDENQPLIAAGCMPNAPVIHGADRCLHCHGHMMDREVAVLAVEPDKRKKVTEHRRNPSSAVLHPHCHEKRLRPHGVAYASVMVSQT